MFRYRGLRKDILLSLLCPLFFYLLAILMLTSQLFWEKALIVTIHNKSLCLGRWLHINFMIIPSPSASCWVLLRFQSIKLRQCNPLYWKHIFEQNLYIVGYVDCPHRMLLPSSRGCWDSSLIHWEFLVKEVLACKMETFIQTHTNKSYSLIWFILCYRH